MVNSERLINEFLELVQVNSETKDERGICDLLINKFSALNLHVIEDDSAKVTGHGAGNLICTLPATGEGDSLFFTSHMDTVAPGRNIQPQRTDGWITSDGTTVLGADDKAGVAAMLEAIRVLSETAVPHPQIQFVVTAGEESGLAGSRAMKREQIDAVMGFALDSDGEVGAIVTKAPAQHKLDMRIIGKSAHAGVAPEKGISAITVAAKAIAAMKLGRIDEETTANIGRFEGGQATNVVCEQVSLLAEARSLQNEKVLKQVSHMKETIEKTAEAYKAKAEINTWEMYPGYFHEDDSPVVKRAIRSMASIGRSATIVQSGGGSDANIFSGFGIPTINLGLGYEGIHTTEERIPESELIKAAELIVAIASEA
ncbi:M20/M25/M40 family metallo-hydrolase [Aureibacillus halotolerans]|uniref:Tripeptide aminopeptidase n=1 Tax=Aureibacillus halotolerans TaxID=1508390 RepID=A0A4R6U9G5_9BACI|nr:M20/M25/M40 family metallo-hydrolase [Aureibacillus halotolerans]TDQ41623.1 tripeptide aminopeptidase [Aureibacillus halotolerans]